VHLRLRLVRDHLPDLALLVRDVHARHPLAVDLAAFGSRDACDDCKAEALPLQQLFKSEASRALFASLAKQFCLRLDLFAPHICNGTVDVFVDVRTHISHTPRARERERERER
jgi:hypothetical protein